MTRFSRTVRAGKTLGFWNFRRTPALAISASERFVRSWVSPRRIRPDLALVIPVIASSRVVFPAPFGPITARTSPESTASDRESSAWKAPKTTLRLSMMSALMVALRPVAAMSA
jgi:hypothetical protein